MIKRKSLAFRIVFRVLLISSLLFIVALTGYNLMSSRIIKKSAQINAIQLAGNLSGKIEQRLGPLEKIPIMLGQILEMDLIAQSDLDNVLNRILDTNPEIFGAAVAFEPGVLLADDSLFMRYAYRQDKGVVTESLGGVGYEFILMDWYQIPKMLESPHWSEPYFDEGGGNELMTTYSVPFYSQTERGVEFAGIATIDICLDWLSDIVSNIRIFDSGFAYLLTRNGVTITHPDTSLIMNESIFSNSENDDEPLLREIGQDLQKGQSQFRKYDLKGQEKQWIYYTPLPSGMWSLAVIFPDSEMFSELNKANIMLILFILVGLIFLILSINHTVRNTSKPLVSLTGSALEIAEGNFSTQLPDIKSNDEILDLRNSFSYMQDQLVKYIANLKETTAAKERIESELRIAREIQMSMVPHVFPPFSNLEQVELSAVLRPAKEVGGDLYDFFSIDEKRFCFAVGDVSGKGVPAALFMAITCKLLRSIAGKYSDPESIISILNNSLAQNNESCMFVTFFFGILDISTGQISYVNAGHNPPIITKSSGELKILESDGFIPLGIEENYRYKKSEVKMEVGDQLFAYTDGVSEAENEQLQLLGEDAVTEFLSEHNHLKPSDMIQSFELRLEKHAKSCQQSDDITMLSLRYNG